MARYQLPKFGDDSDADEPPNKKEAAKAAPPVQPVEVFELDIYRGPARPPMAYIDHNNPPGYYLKDLETLLHPDDYKQLTKVVPVCGTLAGGEIVYALDYIRWRRKMEE